MGFDIFSDKKSVANTSTNVALDSYNRSFNNVSNQADSNNLTIAVGPGSGDAFTKSGDAVQQTALKAAGVALVVAAIAWAYSSGKR